MRHMSKYFVVKDMALSVRKFSCHSGGLCAISKQKYELIT
jgi:hypothetical protein